MKKLLRVLGWILFAGVLLIVFAIAYSTAMGRVTWVFRVNGSVLVNGQKTSGYLHADPQRTSIFLTRTDEGRRETYRVRVLGRKAVDDCLDWSPPRFLPFPLRSDDEAPCMGLPARSTVMDAPVGATLIPSRRSVEFTTSSGKTIKAEW